MRASGWEDARSDGFAQVAIASTGTISFLYPLLCPPIVYRRLRLCYTGDGVSRKGHRFAVPGAAPIWAHDYVPDPEPHEGELTRSKTTTQTEDPSVGKSQEA